MLTFRGRRSAELVDGLAPLVQVLVWLSATTGACRTAIGNLLQYDAFFGSFGPHLLLWTSKQICNDHESSGWSHTSEPCQVNFRPGRSLTLKWASLRWVGIHWATSFPRLARRQLSPMHPAAARGSEGRILSKAAYIVIHQHEELETFRRAPFPRRRPRQQRRMISLRPHE